MGGGGGGSLVLTQLGVFFFISYSVTDKEKTTKDCGVPENIHIHPTEHG